jgi:WD40 repeat protein
MEGRLDLFDAGFLSASMPSAHLFAYPDQSVMINQVEFLESSTVVLAASVWDAGGLAAWDTATDEVRQIVRKPVDHFALIPGTSHVALATWQLGVPVDPLAPIDIVDTRSGEINQIPIEGDFGYYVAASPDGRYLAAVVDGHLVLWDLDTRRQVPMVFDGEDANYIKAEFSPDGQLVALRTNDLTPLEWRSSPDVKSNGADFELIVIEPETWVASSGVRVRGMSDFDASKTDQVVVTRDPTGLSVWKIP